VSSGFGQRKRVKGVRHGPAEPARGPLCAIYRPEWSCQNYKRFFSFFFFLLFFLFFSVSLFFFSTGRTGPSVLKTDQRDGLCMSVVQEAASLDHIRQALLTLLSPDAPGLINESTKTRKKKTLGVGGSQTRSGRKHIGVYFQDSKKSKPGKKQGKKTVITQQEGRGSPGLLSARR